MGDLTFKACSENVSGVFTVSDEEILDAMKLMMKSVRVFPEPSGAASLAALLAGRDVDRLGKRVVLVVSGGNDSAEAAGPAPHFLAFQQQWRGILTAERGGTSQS